MFWGNSLNREIYSFSGLALEKEKDKDSAKRHTMSHPPDHIPELDSPRQSRSPLKKGKKEQVNWIHKVNKRFDNSINRMLGARKIISYSF